MNGPGADNTQLQSSTCSVTAQFIQGKSGKLFSLYYTPNSTASPTQAVIFFPPFAEEMNKSRRMVSLQARRFCEQGLAVLIPDLYGTGDSEGDFGDTTWKIWQKDAETAIDWLKQQGINSCIFWALRMGVFLALQSASSTNMALSKLILWQPPASGEMLLTQFLRLRMAADLMSNEDKITTKDLRGQLTNGDSVEIAGYMLSPTLAQAIDKLQLASQKFKKKSDIAWIEVLPNESRSISAVSKKVIDQWSADGLNVQYSKVVGEQFWASIEIAEIPELLDISCQQLP